MSLIAPLHSDGSVACADCGSLWSVPQLARLVAARRMREEGFAFIDFGDAVLINHCPSCELSPLIPKGVHAWPTDATPPS